MTGVDLRSGGPGVKKNKGREGWEGWDGWEGDGEGWEGDGEGWEGDGEGDGDGGREERSDVAVALVFQTSTPTHGPNQTSVFDFFDLPASGVVGASWSAVGRVVIGCGRVVVGVVGRGRVVVGGGRVVVGGGRVVVGVGASWSVARRGRCGRVVVGVGASWARRGRARVVVGVRASSSAIRDGSTRWRGCVLDRRRSWECRLVNPSQVQLGPGSGQEKGAGVKLSLYKEFTRLPVLAWSLFEGAWLG
ncbi:hypothetical protein B0H14DRAFT_2653983 [Mycena olivaceomarginata]|nr:hypothetical protein B0H14DRAFT_2653983 [Mycena olivaceomarginata]